jgi:transposase
VGIDSHKKTLAAFVLGPDGRPAQFTIANAEADVRKLARRLTRRSAGAEIRACYEAGTCGYTLQRRLEAAGVACEVIAPSLIPRKPGERIKTDHRDALEARRAPPRRSSHRCIGAMDKQIEQAAQLPLYRDRVAWLRCFRGIDTTVATIFVTELHVIEQFDSPRALAAYLGLVPTLQASGDSAHRGKITKTGNSHIRRALVQPAGNTVTLPVSGRSSMHVAWRLPHRLRGPE